MGKGRIMSRAVKSSITPLGRWCPPANSHAICVGMVLDGKTGGGRSGVKTRFVKATKGCKEHNDDASKVSV